MKKSTLAIVVALIGVLVCVCLFIWIGVLYYSGAFQLHQAVRQATAVPLSTQPSPPRANASLVGTWLCDDCGGRIGVTVLREYHSDGTWTGHVTDDAGNTYDYHGTYTVLSNSQYRELDFTDPENASPQPGIYNYSITGNTLTLSLAEGETLTAVFQRVN